MINLDDPKGDELAAQLRGPEAWTYFAAGDAWLRAERIAYADGGLGSRWSGARRARRCRSALIGEYVPTCWP